MATLPIVMILLAAAMIVGPIMMLQPTARQRKLGALRQSAATHGLLVSIPEEKDLQGHSLACYVLPITKTKPSPKTWALCKQSFVHDLHYSDDWDWVSETQQLAKPPTSLRTCLNDCPKGTYSMGRNAVGVYIEWDEYAKEGAEDVAVTNITHFLAKLAAETHYAK